MRNFFSLIAILTLVLVAGCNPVTETTPTPAPTITVVEGAEFDADPPMQVDVMMRDGFDNAGRDPIGRCQHMGGRPEQNPDGSVLCVDIDY